MATYVEIGEDMFGMILNEFTNGYMTTAGFVPKDEAVITQDKIMGSVTYDAEHCQCLPVAWPHMLWLDDRDERMRIDRIDYNVARPYIMADGYASDNVTG